MRTYESVIEELKANGISGYRAEIYDFRDYPKAELFNLFFSFCQEYLDRKDHPFNIEPARMYYSTSTDVNACAYVQNGYYLVQIDKGVIFRLHDFFQSRSAIFNNTLFDAFRGICQKVDAAPEYLIFQFVTLFFIYHEVGHLVQRIASTMVEPEFMAERCTEEALIEEKHARELDADWFSTTPLAMHIIEHAKGDNVDLESLATIALAGIYCFFIMNAVHFTEIYFNRECHPHPSIRLSYMITFLTDAIIHNNGRIDASAVLRNAIQLAENIMMDEENIVERHSVELYQKLDAIEEYVNLILEKRSGFPYMCGNILTTDELP